MPQILSLGEALIDVFAEEGTSLRTAKTLHPTPGGAPANVAVALARLGADVGFIGKVGDDQFGALLIERLMDEGVDTTHFVADPRAPTMLAMVAAPSPEEQHFILYPGANRLLAPADLPGKAIRDADILLYGSVTLADTSRVAAQQAAAWAREAGKHLFFDVNLRPAVWPDLETARRHIEQAISTATIVKLNESELSFLTGSDDPALGSQQLLAQGVQLCLVSLGAEGAYFNNGIVSGHVPGFNVEVRDTTGSGDAFVAGMAHQIAQLNWPLNKLDRESFRTMLIFANACGALAATRVGAMSALPTSEEVQQFMQDRHDQ